MFKKRRLFDHDAGTNQGSGFGIQGKTLVNPTTAFGFATELTTDPAIDSETGDLELSFDVDVQIAAFQKVYLESITGTVSIYNENTDTWYDITPIVAVEAFPFDISVQAKNPNIGTTITPGNSKAFTFLRNSQNFAKVFWCINPTVTVKLTIPKGSLPYTPDATNTTIVKANVTGMFRYDDN